MSVRPSRIGHVGLVARDLAGMVDFYERALGMQVSDRMPFPAASPFYEGVWLRINTDHHVISMFGLRDGVASNGRGQGREPRPGTHHIGFEVPSFEDLKEAARYAREHDIPIQGTRSGGPGCQLRVYLWDPEDNMIELYWAMDRIGWDGASRPYPPVEPIDIETFDVEAWLDWKGPEFKPHAAQAGVAGARPT
jgi:catechol 2,3-dioxygenase-like lactoylglutathione lyase family enzyme